MNSQSHDLPTDEARLTQAARTDAEAFAELYRRYAANVFRYHMAHIGSRKDAEDLTSQTFMAALESIHSYRGAGSFVAWLMGIASRKRALFFRGRKRAVPLDSVLQLPDPQPAPDQSAFQQLQIESVSRALRRLSPERADAIVCCFFGGLTHAETASVLGKSEAAVKMLIARGLQDLRERTSLALEVEQ